MNNTRRQIIETAFLLFLKKGFKAVRLSDIERAAKITRGTFYYHFTNKEEVLKEGLYSYYAIIIQHGHSVVKFLKFFAFR